MAYSVLDVISLGPANMTEIELILALAIIAAMGLLPWLLAKWKL
jgi:hypothetical protein